MTVQELIDELQKIEDKNLPIFYEDNEYGCIDIDDILCWGYEDQVTKVVIS